MSDYYDLGDYYSVKVSTAVPQAQLWFDRGVMWCYGFNHEEAISCFTKALGYDKNLAMGYWGLAYAAGPNYNKPWKAFDEKDLLETLERTYTAIQLALENIEGVSPVEQALITALCARCQNSETVKNLDAWNDSFSNEMRLVYKQYPDDLFVNTVFVESMMNRTPWQLWDLKLKMPAQGADTLEIIEVLDRILKQIEGNNGKPHAGLLHMLVHVFEMSPYPQRALKAADKLRGLVPDSGHLQHMPTHIDMLCGYYKSVVDGNNDGIEADRKYLEKEGPLNFYTFYRCHNYHFKVYGAMFLGQFETAMDAVLEMKEKLPEELLLVESPPMADWLEGFIPIEQHVLIRFGKWQQIIDQPLPDNRELYCYTVATMHYAKSVAFAASGQVPEAIKEAGNFEHALTKVPESRYFLNNSCLDILSIAKEMMYGEIEYRKGNFEVAFSHLRKSVELDDNLPYDEPWGWMQPTRHALGALLMEQRRYAEAAQVYAEDLGLDETLSRACQHPDNIWSLRGYLECLQKTGRTAEAILVKQRLDLAEGRTDTEVKSSCFCKLGSH